MSEPYQSLADSKWDRKYRVMFVPKGRRKAMSAGNWAAG
jgi:hypothetical protein